MKIRFLKKISNRSYFFLVFNNIKNFPKTDKIATDNNMEGGGGGGGGGGGAVEDEELFWYLLEKAGEQLQCGVLFNGIFRSTLHHTLSEY